MQITLIDLHGSLIDAARKLGWTGVEMRPWTDVKDIPLVPGTAFVSPANSFGLMDGGIDYMLSRVMFPGIEARVIAAYEARGHKTCLGRPYLPIGEAEVVPTEKEGVYLISAPTMWTPQDVRDTHNAYHAMYAILQIAAVHRHDIYHIVLCGLCTGCGMMEPEVAVGQMKAAYDDFTTGLAPRYSSQEIIDEQPNTCENVE